MIHAITRLTTAQPMTRPARATDPSYELMDDHNGLSIIYRQHGFPVRWCAGTSIRNTSCI